MNLIEKLMLSMGFARIKSPRYMSIRSTSQEARGDKDTKELLHSYRGWVFGAVTALAERTANFNELKLYKTGNGGEKVQVDKHPAIEVLRRVNSFFTFSDLIELTQQNKELAGEHFWWVAKTVGGIPGEIWPLYPQWVKIYPHATEFIRGYGYKVPGHEEIPFDTDEIIHFKNINPSNYYRGISPLRAAALAFDTDEYASKFNRNFFKNEAEPGGVLMTDQKLSDDAYNRVKAQWKAEHGGIDNAHKTAILEQGLKYQQVGFAQRDMQFLEQREFSRDEIFATFRVPKTALMMTEGVTVSNTEAIENAFLSNVIWPKQKKIADSLNEFYLPMFKNADDLHFECENPAPEDSDKKAQKHNLLGGKVYTINESREEFGLDPIDGGDQVYVALNQVPVGETNVNEEKLAKTERENRLLHSQVRYLITDRNSKVVKKKSVKIDRDQAKKEFLVKQGRTERKFKKVVKKLFIDQRDEILARLTEGKQAKAVTKDLLQIALFELDTETAVWVQGLIGIYEEMIVTEGQNSLDFLDLDQEYLITSHQAARFLDQIPNNITNINETTRNSLTDTLAEGIEANESIDDLAERVTLVYDNAIGFRAERIARTETVKTYNFARLDGYAQSGVVGQKEWLTTHDDRTRDGINSEYDHLSADGQIRDLRYPFEVSGEDLMHPGDPDGSPGNIINCRCTILPVID